MDRQAHRAPQAPQDRLVHKETQVKLDLLEILDRLEATGQQAQPDLRDQLVLLAEQETKVLQDLAARLDLKALQAQLETQDLLARKVLLDRRETREIRDRLVTMGLLVL